MQVVGWPIRGTRSWTEEIAWLVAYGAAPEARWHVFDTALTKRLQAIEAQQLAGQQQVALAEAAVATAGEALASVQQAASTVWRRRLPVAVAVAVLALVLLSLAHWMAALIAAAPAAAALGVVAARARRERAAQADAEAGARQALQAAQAELDAARSALAECRRLHVEATAERVALVPPSRLQAVGRLHLPVARLDTGRHVLALDLSGVTTATAVEVPDLGGEPETLERVRRAVQDVRSCPVMLEGDTTPGRVGTLYGLERTLRAAVDDFNDMLQRSPVLSVRLPLLARDATLLRLSRQATDTAPGALLPGLTWRDTGPVMAHARRLVEAAQRLHRTSQDVAALLDELQHGLETAVTTYHELRHEALQRLRTAVDDVLGPSMLLYATWYCPKCNRVPAYLFHKLGVDPQEAHRADPAALFDTLQRDPEVRERIVADETLLLRIQDAWTALGVIEAEIEGWETRWRTRLANVTPDLLETRAHQARLRALASQYRVHLEQFRAGLRHAVTGNPRPLIELSPQARLYLDPDSRLWSCGVCGTTFSDTAVASMGRLLKIKDQLLMPMWNHLWVEKDDFRKSELFRTNEQIQRLVEKEVVALRDVSEQYRADMRPVRENLIRDVTDARTRRGQLAATLDSLVAVGLSPLKDSSEATERLALLTGGDLEDYRRHAEAKETLLDKEPQEQMQRRFPAVDPMNQFLTPETLFRVQETQAERLLPAPTEGRLA